MPRRKVRKVGKSCRNSSKRSTMSTTPKGFDGSLNHACMGDANGNHWNKRWIIDQFFKLVSKIESMNVHVHAWDKIKLIKATRIHNIEIKWAEDLKQCLLNGCFLSHGQFSLPTSVRQFPASNVDCYVSLYIYRCIIQGSFAQLQVIMQKLLNFEPSCLLSHGDWKTVYWHCCQKAFGHECAQGFLPIIAGKQSQKYYIYI